MSMIGFLNQITSDQMQRFLSDPCTLDSFLMESFRISHKTPQSDADVSCLCLDKSWHVVHFLLTGDFWESPPPLGNVVLGGTEIGYDTGYGPVRFLTPAEVQEASDALQAISREEFANRFDAKALKEEEIYPAVWQEGDSIDIFLIDTFAKVQEFYASAAARGNAMLLYIL